MVLQRESRLPRELLQTGLRPILMNLADPRKLSVSGLEGLARLLELLTNYFKVEIGLKLLDHFRVVADAQTLQQSARHPLSEDEGIIKLVRLANIFHLLPSAANVFMDQLVTNIVQTEAQLQCSGPSPFSLPLGKYLNRYHEEAVDYFIAHLNSPRYLRTLRNILQADLAPDLEAEIIGRTPILISQYLLGGDSALLDATLSLFTDLTNLNPSWLTDNTAVVDALCTVWRSQPDSLPLDSDPGPELLQRSSMLISIFINALKQTPRIDLLFDLIGAYRRNLGVDTVKVTNFLYQHVVASEDVAFKRNILLRFIIWFSEEDVSWTDKASFIRFVVTPVLLVQANLPDEKSFLVNEDFANHLHRVIWHPLAESNVFPVDEHILACELLHLTTIMVQHYGTLLENAKKDIIRCASKFETHADVIVKQTAFLLSARFFAAFPTPSKFILRTWTGLLRLPPDDGRPQLRQEAFAALAPCLPSSSDSRENPQWANIAQKMLAEEGQMQLVVTIYQLIVKEPTLFYPVRAMFVPHMVSSLNKLGMSPAAISVTRQLTVDVVEVIYNWDEQAKNAMVDGEDAAWRPSLPLRENMLSYVVRLASFWVDPPKQTYTTPFVPRIHALLRRMAGRSGWRDVAFGLRFFLKALEQVKSYSQFL